MVIMEMESVENVTLGRQEGTGKGARVECWP